RRRSPSALPRAPGPPRAAGPEPIQAKRSPGAPDAGADDLDSKPARSNLAVRLSVSQAGPQPSRGVVGITSASGDVLFRKEDQGGLHPPADVRGVGEVELEEDRVDVLLDRALGQDELVGDRLVVVSARDEREDLDLSRRQLRERRTGGASAGL